MSEEGLTQALHRLRMLARGPQPIVREFQGYEAVALLEYIERLEAASAAVTEIRSALQDLGYGQRKSPHR